MSQNLIDYRKEITDTAHKLVAEAEPYADKSQELVSSINFIKNFIEEKLAQNQPEIMVYGIYNAGKSSIINELIGKDEAEVNDKPTTDRVQYFNFNGYRIADTPGVGAPIQHEQITQAHLRKADVVVFVMSNTGSHELSQNYDRIRDIYNSDKKVIIVLNDKNGSLNKPGDTSIDEIKFKIGQNLNAVNLQNKFHIVTVNALRAKRGRIEHKPKLYEMSNMDELFQIITQELKNSESYRRWRSMISQIIDESGKILRELDNIINHSLSADVISNYLNLVREQEQSLRSNINSFIDRRIGSMSATLPGIIWDLRDDKDKAEEMINQTVKENLSFIKENLRDLLRAMKEILDDNAKELGTKVGDTPSNVEKIDYQSSQEEFQDIINLLDKGLADDNKRYVDLENDKSEYNNESSLEKRMSTNLLSSTLATSAITRILPSISLKAFVPYVGPILLGVALLASLFGGGSKKESLEDEAYQINQREQARIQAEMQARRELENKCRYMCMNISDKLKKSISEIVSEMSKLLVAPCKDLAFQIKEDSGQLVEHREAVSRYISILENMQEILKSEELKK